MSIIPSDFCPQTCQLGEQFTKSENDPTRDIMNQIPSSSNFSLPTLLGYSDPSSVIQDGTNKPNDAETINSSKQEVNRELSCSCGLIFHDSAKFIHHAQHCTSSLHFTPKRTSDSTSEDLTPTGGESTSQIALDLSVRPLKKSDELLLFSCPECNASDMRLDRTQLITHFQQAHANKCNYHCTCGEYFDWTPNWLLHRLDCGRNDARENGQLVPHDIDMPKLLTCSLCGKGNIPTNSALFSHVRYCLSRIQSHSPQKMAHHSDSGQIFTRNSPNRSCEPSPTAWKPQLSDLHSSVNSRCHSSTSKRFDPFSYGDQPSVLGNRNSNSYFPPVSTNYLIPMLSGPASNRAVHRILPNKQADPRIFSPVKYQINPDSNAATSHGSTDLARPFKCCHCIKAFKSKALLDQHMHIHYPPKYTCRYCAKKYRWPPVFYHHQRTCKKRPPTTTNNSTNNDQQTSHSVTASRQLGTTSETFSHSRLNSDLLIGKLHNPTSMSEACLDMMGSNRNTSNNEFQKNFLSSTASSIHFNKLLSAMGIQFPLLPLPPPLGLSTNPYFTQNSMETIPRNSPSNPYTSLPPGLTLPPPLPPFLNPNIIPPFMLSNNFVTNSVPKSPIVVTSGQRNPLLLDVNGKSTNPSTDPNRQSVNMMNCESTCFCGMKFDHVQSYLKHLPNCNNFQHLVRSREKLINHTGAKNNIMKTDLLSDEPKPNDHLITKIIEQNKQEAIVMPEAPEDSVSKAAQLFSSVVSVAMNAFTNEIDEPPLPSKIPGRDHGKSDRIDEIHSPSSNPINSNIPYLNNTQSNPGSTDEEINDGFNLEISCKYPTTNKHAPLLDLVPDSPYSTHTEEIPRQYMDSSLVLPHPLLAFMAKALSESGSKSIPPPLSSFDFPNFNSYELNESPTSNGTPKLCLQCGKEFSSRLSLKQHVEGKHSAEGKYQCPGCAKRYRWGASYYYHKKSCAAIREQSPPIGSGIGQRSAHTLPFSPNELSQPNGEYIHRSPPYLTTSDSMFYESDVQFDSLIKTRNSKVRSSLCEIPPATGNSEEPNKPMDWTVLNRLSSSEPSCENIKRSNSPDMPES